MGANENIFTYFLKCYLKETRKDVNNWCDRRKRFPTVNISFFLFFRCLRWGVKEEEEEKKTRCNEMTDDYHQPMSMVLFHSTGFFFSRSFRFIIILLLNSPLFSSFFVLSRARRVFLRCSTVMSSSLSSAIVLGFLFFCFDSNPDCIFSCSNDYL